MRDKLWVKYGPEFLLYNNKSAEQLFPGDENEK